jgi:predicted metal-dependent phosphoesterase TrpH
MLRTRLTIAVLFGGGVLVAGRARPATQAPANSLHWYKGNTHTHTLNSDGDSTPDDVVRWYREHSYQFLVLSDHNFLTSVDGLNALHAADEKFLVIKGEEVSDRAGGKPIHVNGLDVAEPVAAPGGSTALDVMQRMVDGIRKSNGVPHINHPNFGWAITADDLLQVQNTKLFEIYNGHPAVNNFGGGGVPGMEEVWDRLLSSGKLIYGIADDDAHVFKQPWHAGEPLPGRGWVYVHADRLAPRAIVEALDRGDFYASTGVELNGYQVTPSAITIEIKQGTVSKYRVQFVGRNGQILSEVTSTPAVYRFKGDELYVRAKVLESNGRLAWTQPVWRGR